VKAPDGESTAALRAEIERQKVELDQWYGAWEKACHERDGARAQLLVFRTVVARQIEELERASEAARKGKPHASLAYVHTALLALQTALEKKSCKK
jgi:hypothetical protein